MATENHEDFHDLMARAKDGDREAIDRLLDRLRPFMERVAKGYAEADRVVESTSDLVQEAWVKAWQKLDQFNGGDNDEESFAMFRSWVSQIVHRLGLNAQRDRRTQRRKPKGRAVVSMHNQKTGSTTGAFQPKADDPTPSAVVRVDEEARIVREALAKIPDETDRSIFRMRFFEGLSLREIASRLELTYDQARERYRKNLKQLERDLGNLE